MDRTAAIVAAAVFGPMMLEAIRAARNERAQRALGGIEPAGDVYAWMRIAYPAVFLAMIGEGAMTGATATAVMLAAGVVLFAASKALKWWAIATLGSAWTFRVIVVPGSTLVRGGPYRWLTHPNYVAVVGEMAAVGLMMAARVTAPISIMGFGALMLKRVAVERRALDAILRPVRLGRQGADPGHD